MLDAYQRKKTSVQVIFRNTLVSLGQSGNGNDINGSVIDMSTEEFQSNILGERKVEHRM